MTNSTYLLRKALAKLLNLNFEQDRIRDCSKSDQQPPGDDGGIQQKNIPKYETMRKIANPNSSPDAGSRMHQPEIKCVNGHKR